MYINEGNREDQETKKSDKFYYESIVKLDFLLEEISLKNKKN